MFTRNVGLGLGIGAGFGRYEFNETVGVLISDSEDLKFKGDGLCLDNRFFVRGKNVAFTLGVTYHMRKIKVGSYDNMAWISDYGFTNMEYEYSVHESNSRGTMFSQLSVSVGLGYCF